MNERDATASPKRHRGWRRLGLVVVVLVIIGSALRVMMPWAVRDYVNRTLDRNPLYQGTIGPVTLQLWRGAYSIQDVNISKPTAEVPVPFFKAKRVDFAIQWNALLHRKVVGRIVMEQPEINFVASPNANESQSGSGAPWLEMIQGLFPFRINSGVIKDGSVHFRTYQSEQPVDVYLSSVEGSVDNLSNVRDETTPLVSTVQATALVMDQAKLEYKMTLDPFSYRPTFHMAVRLLGLDVTRLNDLARTYAKLDFKRGWFDLVLEAESNEGQINGYAKPLFRNLKVFSLSEDLKEDTVLQFFWQAVAGGVVKLFKNQPHDQLGTLIPFTGDASGTSADILATIGNLLRNAFVRAYLPQLQSGQEGVDGLQFEPPDISDPVSSGDTS